jgi:type IV secretion system protein VirB10
VRNTTNEETANNKSSFSKRRRPDSAYSSHQSIRDEEVSGEVNNHYARIFGASLAIGALGAAAEVGTGNVFNQSSTDRMRQGLGASLAQSSERILDKFLNILPTVTIREGLRVKVYLSNDLVLPDYQSHTTPADL